jgi:hypothetical protein
MIVNGKRANFGLGVTEPAPIGGEQKLGDLILARFSFRKVRHS